MAVRPVVYKLPTSTDMPKFNPTGDEFISSENTYDGGFHGSTTKYQGLLRLFKAVEHERNFLRAEVGGYRYVCCNQVSRGQWLTSKHCYSLNSDRIDGLEGGFKELL